MLWGIITADMATFRATFQHIASGPMTTTIEEMQGKEGWGEQRQRDKGCKGVVDGENNHSR